MSGKSREKGKTGERELARVLRAEGFDARRGVQYRGDAGSPDVVGLPGIHIEVKRTECFRMWDALAQSKGEAGEHELPVVVHRKNRCEWVVVQPLADWLELYREWMPNAEPEPDEEAS